MFLAIIFTSFLINWITFGVFFGHPSFVSFVQSFHVQRFFFFLSSRISKSLNIVIDVVIFFLRCAIEILWWILNYLPMKSATFTYLRKFLLQENVSVFFFCRIGLGWTPHVQNVQAVLSILIYAEFTMKIGQDFCDIQYIYISTSPRSPMSTNFQWYFVLILMNFFILRMFVNLSVWNRLFSIYIYLRCHIFCVGFLQQKIRINLYVRGP